MTDKRKPGGRKPGGLSQADLDLWRQVTRSTKPLQERPVRDPRHAPDTRDTPNGAPRKAGPQEPPKRAGRLPRAQPVPLVPKRAAAAPDLEHGGTAGVARRQAEKLRRGLLPIEGKLDLHGHTQHEAHRELSQFIASAQGAGKRCVIVVTGRGIGKDAGGILRQMVPRWLNQAPNRGRVLAFAQAQPKHGGAGALYVLLKRSRGG